MFPWKRNTSRREQTSSRADISIIRKRTDKLEDLSAKAARRG